MSTSVSICHKYQVPVTLHQTNRLAGNVNDFFFQILQIILNNAKMFHISFTSCVTVWSNCLLKTDLSHCHLANLHHMSNSGSSDVKINQHMEIITQRKG